MVLKSRVDRDHDQIINEVVLALPKTRSGKILRGTMQKIADGQDYKLAATIEDSAVLTRVGEQDCRQRR